MSNNAHTNREFIKSRYNLIHDNFLIVSGDLNNFKQYLNPQILQFQMNKMTLPLYIYLAFKHFNCSLTKIFISFINQSLP